MGIFGRNDKRSAGQNGATIIPKGTHIIGGINSNGIIHIDGKFEGIITSASYIIIGKSGEFYGKIDANNVSVSGILDGEVDCQHIHILSSGKVIGELRYDKLTIDPEGVFEGQGKVKNFTLSSRYSEVQKSIKGNSFIKKENE